MGWYGSLAAAGGANGCRSPAPWQPHLGLAAGPAYWPGERFGG